MYSFRRMLGAAALLVAMSPAAHALDLFTPPSQSVGGSGTIMLCYIVNVGTKPIEVSATVRNYHDSSDMSHPSFQCPATLAPGEGCNTVGPSGGIHTGYCHFTTTSSKVRAALLVVNAFTGDVTSAFAATK
jgi:hypothetical protein